MKTIYKYCIELGKNEIEMPAGAAILSAEFDPWERLCVWALIDTEKEKETVNIYCVGTSWDLDTFFEEDVTFINTVKQDVFMWHIFKGGRNE